MSSATKRTCGMWLARSPGSSASARCRRRPRRSCARREATAAPARRKGTSRPRRARARRTRSTSSRPRLVGVVLDLRGPAGTSGCRRGCPSRRRSCRCRGRRSPPAISTSENIITRTTAVPGLVAHPVRAGRPAGEEHDVVRLEHRRTPPGSAASACPAGRGATPPRRTRSGTGRSPGRAGAGRRHPGDGGRRASSRGGSAGPEPVGVLVVVLELRLGDVQLAHAVKAAARGSACAVSSPAASSTGRPSR